jgi:hypothetical protein
VARIVEKYDTVSTQNIVPFPLPEEAPVEEKFLARLKNTQTVTDDVLLNARQVAKVLFGNDSHPARNILYTPKMKKALGAWSRGKGCKMFFIESKVLAYEAKQPKRLNGFSMYLPEPSQARH